MLPWKWPNFKESMFWFWRFRILSGHIFGSKDVCMLSMRTVGWEGFLREVFSRNLYIQDLHFSKSNIRIQVLLLLSSPWPIFNYLHKREVCRLTSCKELLLKTINRIFHHTFCIFPIVSNFQHPGSTVRVSYLNLIKLSH